MPGRRKRMQKRFSKKVFTRGAQRVHPKNMTNRIVMRGGIRL